MAVATSKYMYFNGEIVAFADAKVHILSVGMAYASTVFEGLRGYWNDEKQELYVFRLPEHCARLMQSMKLLRMDTDLNEPILAESIMQLLKANELKEDAHIRQLAFVDAVGPIHTATPVSLAVAAMPSYRLFDATKGATAAFSSWRRIADDSLPPRIKCTANYQNGRHAQIQAKLDGYDAPILLNNRGKVAEGPTMCIFLVRDGKVITPELTSGVLESITRATVIQLLAEQHGVVVEEREVDRTEFYVADEAFFAGTACEVLPITAVDKHALSGGSVGELTRALQQTYLDVVYGRRADYAHWRTPVYGS